MQHKRKINYSRLALLIGCVLLLAAGAGFGISRLSASRTHGNVSEEPKPARQTASYDLSSLLGHGIEPVGQVMYVWGGGWNEEDTGSGPETRQLGMASAWIEFANSQDSSYSVDDHLYEIHNGLDCSGYIGWVLYNTFETENGKEGYVDFSQNIGPDLAAKGYGTMIPADQITSYEPGDLLANPDHIYMVLGQCSDGSVLLVHSSPPGVRICGTPAMDGNVESKAVSLARSIMSTYVPEWYAKYPDCTADYSFLTDYDQFRWDADKLKDENGLRNKPAEDIVSYLFSS